MKNEKPVKTVLRPSSGKLDEKACPVLHLNRPGLLHLFQIKPVDVVFKTGTGFLVDRQRLNELYLSEGAYDLVFTGAYYSSITQRESEGGQHTLSISGLGVGPLHLRVHARNGHHYYFFAPAELVTPETGKLPVPNDPTEQRILDVAGALRKQGVYGVLGVCGFSSARLLTEDEEIEARKSSKRGCDILDPKQIAPGTQRRGPGTVIE